MYNQRIKTFIGNNKNNVINTLSELIGIKSVMSEPLEKMPFGKGPHDALIKMLSIADSLGFKTRNIDNYVGTIDLSEGEPELGILCHLDVVPEGADWDTDPYTLTEANGKLFGRGTIDDKGPAAAALYAMLAVKELGISLKKNVRMIVGTNEENGSADLKYYTSKENMPPMLFTPDGSYPVINIEKGMLRITFECNSQKSDNTRYISSFNGGSVINAVPYNAAAELKGYSLNEIKALISLNKIDLDFSLEENKDYIKITAKGIGAHASTPEKGKNAVTGLIELLSMLDAKKDNTVNLFKSLNKLFPYGECNGEACRLNISDEISGSLTLTFSVFNYSNDKGTGKIDIRFPVCETKQGIIDILNNAFSGENISISDIQGDEPHHVDENSEFVKTLLKVYTKCTGLNAYCIAIGGGTYVHNTKGGVAFGAEFPGDDNNMHGANEFITIDSLLKNIEIFAEAIIELCC